MRDSQIRHMLVCDSEQRLLGIVSARDLSSRPGKTAAELMSRDVRTVSPDMLISPASTQFINMRVSSLPVVEDGRLVGILTATDLVLALQSVLQLWLHAASMMQGEVWEQEFMQSVQSHLDAADADTCCGVKGLIESLMERGQAASSPVAAS
jgi:CBS-domain-containing membrane protein